MAKGDNEVAEKTTNKAGEDPLFDRANNEKRDEFVSRLKKEFKGIQINEFKTSAKVNPTELMVKYRNRNIAHIANRSAMLFCIGIRKDGKNDIRKLKTDKDIEKAFNDLKAYASELDKQPVKKNNKKSNKGSNKKASHKSVEELTESLLRRMAECTNSGISIPKEVDTKATWFQNLVKEKGWKIDTEKNAILKGE